MGERFLFFLLVFVILLPITNAIGLSPDVTYIAYEPLKEGDIQIRVINTVNSPIDILLIFEGDMAKYFKFIDDGEVVPPLGSRAYTIHYKMPYEPEAPGVHQVIVKVKEDLPAGQGVAAVLSVISKIFVDIPFPEKYIDYNVKTENVNIGENIVIEFTLNSKSVENAFVVKPLADIYQDNAIVKNFEGESFALSAGSSKSSNIIFNSTEIGTGSYFVRTHINYDGINSIEKNFSLNVGYEDIIVVDYTKVLSPGGIKEFSLLLKNEWNKPVDGVYYVAYLEKNGVPVTERAFSHTVNFGALETVDIPVFIDLKDIPEGKYGVVAEIHYGNLVKQEKLIVDLKEEFELTTAMIIAFIVIVLIAANYGWIMFNRKDNKEDDKLGRLLEK